MVPHLPLDSKITLRETQKALRQALRAQDHASFSNSCCEQVCRVIGSLASAPLSIAGYSPIHCELDIMPALLSLSEHHTLCLPITSAESKILSFRQFTPHAALIPGRYGVREPALDARTVGPDIVIVPLLAFDREGNRLGYGAGYYDATLKALREVKQVIAIGVGFSLQEASSLTAEPHDEKLDIIVTEQEIILLSF